MAKAVDLIGREFGKLAVIGLADRRGSRRYWLCRCECGNVEDYPPNQLTSGHAVTACSLCRVRTCRVCGEEIPAVGNTQVCPGECRRIDRAGRTLDDPPQRIAESETCDVCGALFKPTRLSEKGCSEECRKIGRLRRKLAACRKGPFLARPCIICGMNFEPIRESNVVCPERECRSQHKRDLATDRAEGKLRPPADALASPSAR